MPALRAICPCRPERRCRGGSQPSSWFWPRRSGSAWRRGSEEPSEPRALRRLSRAEWVIPLALLDALFLAFVIVQLAVLFGGHDRVLRTTGLTYAEYARSGFWQLLAVGGV